MQRVIINEHDVTIAENPALIADIAYIPGFSVANYTDEGNKYAPAGKPTYCSSIAEFKRYFGDTIPTFAADQEYPSGEGGFADIAIPKHGGSGEEPEADLMFASGSPDPSYLYAMELLTLGLPIYYERVNESDTISVDIMYGKLAEIFSGSESKLTDKNEYNIKYLTSGGYPIFEYSGNGLVNGMAALAGSRGDCVAIIDHTNNTTRPIDPTNTDSVYYSFTKDGEGAEKTWSYGSYMTLFTPWYKVDTNYPYDNIEELTMPGSFAYLSGLAISLRDNANWLAIAGVTRGKVSGFRTLTISETMTNAIAEEYTAERGTSINPITNIRPYGYCIWGNKTALNTNTSKGFATSFLNIRNLVSDVKKQVYVAAQSCLFEQNTDILWINFKSLITPLLDQMVSGSGLKNYKIIKLPGSDRDKIKVKIVLIPVYAVEQFIIDIYITDDEVAVDEGE